MLNYFLGFSGILESETLSVQQDQMINQTFVDEKKKKILDKLQKVCSSDPEYSD